MENIKWKMGKRDGKGHYGVSSICHWPFYICHLLCIAATCAAATSTRDTMPDTWAATDALGRVVPVAGDVRPPRSDRFVGMFYFLWMQPSKDNQIYDITQIRAANPAHPHWGPLHAFHWWGQPQFGYYASDDPWVIRKHAQMLSDAGVDVLFFDATNSYTYDKTVTAIGDTYEKIRSEGGRTPQIAFITHANSMKTIEHLYDTIYAKKRYENLWFRWLGKPILMGPSKGLPSKIKDFFTIRASWAWTDRHGWFGDGHNKWPWLDNTPQNFGWHVSPKIPEEIPVSVAGHPVTGIGRSYNNGTEPPPMDRRPATGIYFNDQWTRALNVNPQMVFVTGWNEWIAQRFVREAGQGPTMFLDKPLSVGSTFFVDEYSEEFSRDIEPMLNRHTDDYYYQLVSAIRRYKGARQLPPASAIKTLDIAGSFTQWKNVRPIYLDDLYDTDHRNHVGFDANMRYLNDSGRNDLDEMRVARDGQSVCFYVKTRQPLTEPKGGAWMTLLISSQSPSAQNRPNWQGYDLLINRGRDNVGHCTIERCTGGWNWRNAGQGTIRFAGDQLQISIPRRLVATPGEPLWFDFKWTDNATGSGNAADFNDHGDVAPNGRFNYRFRG